MDYFLSGESETIFKIVLALVLGVVLGLEREVVGKEAGIRTYGLVTLGSCLFSILSFSALNSYPGADDLVFSFDPSRIASQIVVGVGFIGAGLIIFHENKVRGLTTAAGLWTASAIGMAVAFGFYKEALVSTALILLVLYLTRKLRLEERFHI